MWNLNRPLGYILFFLLCLMITLPLLIESIIDWYLYFPPAVFLMVLVFILSNKAYQGIVNHKVRLFPETDLTIRESGYLGGKASSYVKGRWAQIAGGLFLIMDFIIFRWMMKFFAAFVQGLVSHLATSS